MATFKDIEQAITRVFQYQNAETKFPQAAVDLAYKIIRGVRTVMEVGEDDSSVQLVRPSDKYGTGRRIGEHLYAHNDVYTSAVRVTVGRFSADVLFSLTPKNEPGLSAFEHRRWTLAIDQGRDFDLGIDFGGYSTFETDLCRAISEQAKNEIVRKAKEALKPQRKPSDGGDPQSRWTGNGDDRGFG